MELGLVVRGLEGRKVCSVRWRENEREKRHEAPKERFQGMLTVFCVEGFRS